MACWVLQGKDEVGQIICPCVVPGRGKYQSAYRSELAGLYGMVTMIETLCRMYSIEEGQVEIGCDGLQA